MKIADLCRDAVTVVRRDHSIQEAAMLMRRYHVGTVVVIDVDGGRKLRWVL